MMDSTDKEKKENLYTCNEYREEMILAGLRKRLQQTGLTVDERDNLLKEIRELEERMGLN